MASAYIIGFISQKGGVGKSTLARAAAVALTKEGYRVRLGDLDVQQGTTVDWYRRRLQGDSTRLASVEPYSTVGHALSSSLDLNPAFDVIILDAPGRSSQATLAIAQAAHLVIQPATGTLDDLDPGIRLFHDLRKSQVQSSKLLFALARTTSEREEELAKDYIRQAGYAVLEATLPDRSGYKAAQNAGFTVVETFYPSLNQRADALLQEIFQYIKTLYNQASG